MRHIGRMKQASRCFLPMVTRHYSVTKQPCTRLLDALLWGVDLPLRDSIPRRWLTEIEAQLHGKAGSYHVKCLLATNYKGESIYVGVKVEAPTYFGPPSVLEKRSFPVIKRADLVKSADPQMVALRWSVAQSYRLRRRTLAARHLHNIYSTVLNKCKSDREAVTLYPLAAKVVEIHDNLQSFVWSRNANKELLTRLKAVKPYVKPLTPERMKELYGPHVWAHEKIQTLMVACILNPPRRAK